jgi:acyl-CoA synthetase (NDP forming)
MTAERLQEESQEMSDLTGNFVLEPDAVKCLKRYDIPYPDHGLAHSPDEAVQIADRLGYPVVLKIVSGSIIHKSDAGGVAIGLKNAREVAKSYRAIVSRVQTSTVNPLIEGMLVCQQAPEGPEAIVGALDDPVFGATIMFGLGGVFAEILKDVVFRIAPLERLDAEEMITEIKGYPILAGARGRPARDIDKLVHLLLAVSRLVTEKPNIREFDLNPVRLFERGLMVLDVRLIEKTP